MASRFAFIIVIIALLISAPQSSAQEDSETYGPPPPGSEINKNIIDSVGLVDETENESPTIVRVATLQVLNKITALTTNLEISAGSEKRFGNLMINIKDCWKSPPEEKPEVAALIQAHEEKVGEDRVRVFYGWMFASSPAISALEHPVYDIVVKDCKS